MKKEKIIIYGGSFDPPHKAHFRLLKGAIKEIKPDRVYVVTGWRSPFKSFPSVSYLDREKMFRLGAREFDLGAKTKLVFHPFEYKRKKVTYTYQTVNYFFSKYPSAQIFFLMGSDCFNSFNRWKKYTLITKKAILLVGRRRGFMPQGNSEKSTVFLKGVFPEISSSEIKKTLFAYGTVKNIPATVVEFIERKKLYFNQIHKWLKLNLKAKRFNHCKETARLALAIADKHGINLEKTAVAALLHDGARDFKPAKLKAWARKNRKNLPFFRHIMNNEPLIFHSYMSAYIAREKFSIKDKEILDAIKLHTIGAAGMSILAKIIYISDMAEKDRVIPSAPSIRKEVFFSIDKAFFSALKCKLEYLKEKNRWVHPHSLALYKSLLKEKKI
ncbi:MAG: bis(5'-nucleosyl)-tetraphosphatase (symmetrical) YqeK [Elusimicrobiota bacterium]|nr:bis(5'-nucleosyl)-tetraphosphatase (symmetrical) YqeK [Elusimicrobiota bacterium]